MVASPADARSPRTRVLRRLTQVGFLFFLLKGLGWLLVGFFAWRGLS